MTRLHRVGVFAHPSRPRTIPVAERIRDALVARGIDTWLHTKSWTESEVAPQVKAVDMVIAIGGDGAMLRAARVSAPYRIPVLGVNMGQLGFLTEIHRVDDWDAALFRVLDGDYWVEDRMMLQATIVRDGQTILSGDALNDVVISGSVLGRIIQVETYIDDQWATTYRADAVVVATATGSTAYALACGGPILPPELHNILIVPAAAHLSMDRPIVLSEGATVELNSLSSQERAVVVTLDGGVLCQLEPDDRVRVCASDMHSRFVRLRTRNYFYRSLLDRLEPRVSRSQPTENGHDGVVEDDE